MTKHSILDEIPEVLRDKVQRALRNIARISPSSTCTQCAASTFAPNSPCFLTYGTTGIPWTRRDSSTSSSVSDRCVCSGTSNSAASSAHARRISGVHV